MPTMKSFTSCEVAQYADCPARVEGEVEPQDGTAEDF